MGGKRLRKAPEGTVSIKSFFTSLGKPDDRNTSKSSNDSTVTDEEDSDVQDASSDSDWEEKSRTRRKRPRKAKSAGNKKESKVLADKNSKTSRRISTRNKLKDDDIQVIKTVKSVEKPKPVEKEIDAEVAAFLKSGIPAATCKAQKLVAARIEEEELSKTLQHFPVHSHVAEHPHPNWPDHSAWTQNLGLKFTTNSLCENFVPQNISSDKFTDFISANVKQGEIKDLTGLKAETVLCCKISRETTPVEESNGNDIGIKPVSLTDDTLNLPWIEKYEIVAKSDLAVDRDALDKIETWLRHWKHDIKDDGGKSRKFVEKKKRRNSDSDFISSGEDSEFKTKSLLLYGATGCGKTGAISILAKKMGFKLVEVNFSTSRSGKDVLKRVEEATLSHRLESSHACLLLFKDVCLIEPKEDEGFVAAVAQLITSSCRPIVMTMSQPPPPHPFYVGSDCDTLILDTKIQKKDPLYVYFPPQSASIIVKQVLLPIFKSEFPDQQLPRRVISTLYSIARHCKGDIRHSINQTQLLLQTFDSTPIYNFHAHISPGVDLGFVSKFNDKESSCSKNYRSYDARCILSEEKKEVIGTITSTKIARKALRKEINLLDNVVKHLQFAVYLDRGNKFIQNRSHNDQEQDDDIKMGRCETIPSYFDNNLRDLYSLSKNPVPKACSSTPKSLDQDSGNVTAEGDSDASESSLEDSLNFNRTLLPSDFSLHTFLFDSDRNAELTKKAEDLREHIDDYCYEAPEAMMSGPFNFHNHAYFRTIIKTNKLNASGPQQKRNQRMSYYFNRVGNELVEQVCDTFDYQLALGIAKLCRLR